MVFVFRLKGPRVPCLVGVGAGVVGRYLSDLVVLACYSIPLMMFEPHP